VVNLAQHRADPAHLPHQPFVDAGPLLEVGRQQFSGLFSEVEQDCAGLHEREVGLPVDDRRDAVVGGNLKEFGFELFVLGDVHGVRLVGHAELFERDGDLAAVGRGPSVQVDQGDTSSCGVSLGGSEALHRKCGEPKFEQFQALLSRRVLHRR
jgi:hypothetical protein